MTKNNKLLYAAIILSILAFISAYHNSQQFKGHINENMVGTLINKNIKLTELTNGHIKSIKDLDHQYYILSFIASWCGLCGEQYKMISKIKDKYDVPIYGIIWQDYPQNIKQYLAAGKYNYDHVYQDINSKLATELKLYALPTIVLVGPNHQVKFIATGVINDYIIEKYITPELTNK